MGQPQTKPIELPQKKKVSIKIGDEVHEYHIDYINDDTKIIERISETFFKGFFEHFIKDGTGLAIVLKSEEKGIDTDVKDFISRLIKELLVNDLSILDNEEYSDKINTIRVKIVEKLINSIPDMKRRIESNSN